MTPTPLYNPKVENAAYQLRYSWTGWPSSKRFAEQPVQLIEDTKSLWENDGYTCEGKARSCLATSKAEYAIQPQSCGSLRR